MLEQGRLPESWVPPAHILDLRELVRLRKTLNDQRVQWQQRIHAVLFHHGLPKPAQALTSHAARGWLQTVSLPTASRLLVDSVSARSTRPTPAQPTGRLMLADFLT